MKQVETLPLEQVAVGMRLAEAVLDAAGQILVPAGAELSAGLLQGLQRREIGELCIEREIEEDPAAREARRLRVSAQLEQLFRHAGDGEATRQLQQAVLAFRLGQQL